MTVAAYLNHKWGTYETPYMTSSLENLFHVESPPNVTFPAEDFYVEVRNASCFELEKLNPNQTFRIDWDMGDGTVYRDAGVYC